MTVVAVAVSVAFAAATTAVGGYIAGRIWDHFDVGPLPWRSDPHARAWLIWASKKTVVWGHAVAGVGYVAERRWVDAGVAFAVAGIWTQVRGRRPPRRRRAGQGDGWRMPAWVAAMMRPRPRLADLGGGR